MTPTISNTKKILYIIPVRFTHQEERYKNFLYVLKNIDFFFKNISNFEIHTIIVEQNKNSSLKDLIANQYPHFLYEFVYNEGPFNRSWAFNVALKEYPQYDIYTFADADILLTLNRYQQFFSYFNDNKIDFVFKPKEIRDLTKEATERIFSQQTYFSEDLIKNGDYTLDRSKWLNAGCICASTKQCIDSINWWDEEFEGWGCEDDALCFLICNQYKKKYIVPDGFLCHFYHHTNDRFPIHSPFYQRNLKLREEYINFSNNGFRVPRELKGLKNKYLSKIKK